MTKTLVERGAPVTKLIRMHLAKNYGKIDGFRYLKETGADNNIHAPTETATKLLFRVVWKLSRFY